MAALFLASLHWFRCAERLLAHIGLGQGMIAMGLYITIMINDIPISKNKIIG